MNVPVRVRGPLVRRHVRVRLRRAVVPLGTRPVHHGSPLVSAAARAWHGRCLSAYLVAALVAWLASGLVLAVLACCYLALLRYALRVRARRRHTLAAGLLCSEACAGIADDLRAGRSGHLALAVAAETMLTGLRQRKTPCQSSTVACRECLTPLRSIRSWQLVRQATATDGAGVVAALRAVPPPYRFWCTPLAAAWQLHESGMALAAVLDGLDDELASRRRQGQAQRVHTAAARATSTVLGVLPLLGLVVGYAMGAGPVTVLLHTPWGAGCAVIAVSLHCAGWVWAERIASGGLDVGNTPTGGMAGGSWRLPGATSRTTGRRMRGLRLTARAVDGLTVGTDIACPSAPLLARCGVCWTVAALVGTIVGWMVGTPGPAVGVGCVTAIAVVAGARYLRRVDERLAEHAWLDQLPYALVLLAAVLASGAATAQALSLVGGAIGERLGANLRIVGTAMAQGEPIPVAWQRGLGETTHTASLLRALQRSDTSGAALAGAARRLAGQLREQVHVDASARAARCSVVMIAPLMCCFLPAFVLLGVVPVVGSVLSQVLGATL